MITRNMTPWFYDGSNPVHIGVYMVKDQYKSFRYQHWNGKFWGAYGPTISEAHIQADFKSAFQSPIWRGLMEPADDAQ